MKVITQEKQNLTNKGVFAMDPPKALYKASVFGELLPFKKNMFEKFATTGCSFSGPNIMFGDGAHTYEFQVNSAADKVIFKGLNKGGVEFKARHRQNKEYDIETKYKLTSDITALVKLEQRNTRQAVVGVNYATKQLKMDIKVHPMNFAEVSTKNDIKGSFIYKPDMPLNFGGEIATDAGLNSLKYLGGMAYALGNSTLGLTYSHTNTLTADAFTPLTIADKKVDCAAQLNYGLSNGNIEWMVAGVHKYDKEHTFKAKVNNSLQLALACQKQLSPNLKVTAGTVCNANWPTHLINNIGFKIAMNH